MLYTILNMTVVITILGCIASCVKKGRITNNLKKQIDSMNNSFEKNSKKLNNRIEMENKRVVQLEAQVLHLRNQLDKSNEIINCNIIQVINITQEIIDVHETFLDKLTVLDNHLDNQDNQSAKELLKRFLMTDV